MDLLMTILRHSITDKTLGQDQHRLWPLSQQGVLLAQQRRVQLGEPSFDVALCSPLQRTRHTAALIAGLPIEDRSIKTTVEFFPDGGTDNDIGLHAMFGRLAHSPLELYQKQPEAEALRAIAHGAAQRLRELLKSDFKHVLAIGHGIIVPASIEQLLKTVKADNRQLVEQLQNRVLGECEGFQLQFKCGVDPIELVSLTPV